MSTQEVFSVAERIRNSVQLLTFPAPMKNLILTVSMGVACSSRECSTDMDSLLKGADEALYRAKQNGRNRVESATCLISKPCPGSSGDNKK
jgi:diguanylate cyclase (GGDEF)-like protein